MNNRSNAARLESYEIRGDRPRTSSLTGVNATQNALCNPIVLWRDRFLTLDVFQIGDAQPYALVYCPLCAQRDPNNIHNMSLTIRGEQKAIDVKPRAFPRIPGYKTADLIRLLSLPNQDAARGVISIEQFRCSWEEDPGARRDFGFSVCNWSVVIENNVARDV